MVRTLTLLVTLETAVFLVLLLLLAGSPPSRREAPGPAGTPPGPENRPEKIAGSRAPEDPAATGADAGAGRKKEPAGAEGPPPLRGLILYGKITDPAGAPIDSASLALYTGNRRERRIRVRHAGYTAASLEPGDYELRCRGSRIFARSFPLTLTGPEPRRFDLVLERKITLPVRILTPGGESLHETLKKRKIYSLRPAVVATLSPPPGDFPPNDRLHLIRIGVARWRPFLTNEERKGGLDGELVLEQSPPVYASLVLGNVLLATQPIEPGQRNLDFHITPARILAGTATLRFRLVDGSGRPLTPDQIRVTASNSQSSGRMCRPGEDGNGVFPHLIPGYYWLRLGGRSYGRMTLPVLLDPGERRDLGTIRLRPPIRICGRVEDREGTPLTARVRHHHLDRHEPGLPFSYNNLGVASNEEGFRLEGLQPGRYLLEAVVRKPRMVDGRQGWSSRLVGRVIVQATTDVEDLVIRAGGLTSVKLAGWPEAHCHFTILDQGGTPVWALLGGKSASLPPGDYTLLVHRGKELRLRRPFRVGKKEVVLDLGGGK